MTLRFAVLAAAAVMLAACGPETPKAAEPAAGGAPPAEQAAQKRLPLPDCSAPAPAPGQENAAEPEGLPPFTDCRLQDNKSGLGFEARFTDNPTPDEAENLLTIEVVQPGDAVLQTISEQIENTIQPMELRDLDGDGYQEVLVPLMTGNVNTQYAVWHMPAGANQFVRVGEVSGFNFGNKDGFVTVNARSAANIQNLHYYTLANGELKQIATAEFTASGDPNKPTVVCAVIDGKQDDPKGGLAAAGLTPAQAEAKFCSAEARKEAF